MDTDIRSDPHVGDGYIKVLLIRSLSFTLEKMKKKTSPEIEKKSPETQEIVDSGKEIVDSGKEIVDSDEDISTYDSRPKHVRRAEKRAENVANKLAELR
ncbi:hypothetical protein P8452_62938 [Trifolium repens]|nr:hypothetical protein P8452_62938 [Trifolium repens]